MHRHTQGPARNGISSPCVASFKSAGSNCGRAMRPRAVMYISTVFRKTKFNQPLEHASSNSDVPSLFRNQSCFLISWNPYRQTAKGLSSYHGNKFLMRFKNKQPYNSLVQSKYALTGQLCQMQGTACIGASEIHSFRWCLSSKREAEEILSARWQRG